MKTILIVEDENICHLLLKEIINGYYPGKFNLLHAINGKEAIKFCDNKHKIDLVLMDLRLPIVDGLSATKQIKQKHPNLPVIAQTAYANKIEKEKALKVGCSDILIKPISSVALINIIEKYIAGL